MGLRVLYFLMGVEQRFIIRIGLKTACLSCLLKNRTLERWLAEFNRLIGKEIALGVVARGGACFQFLCGFDKGLAISANSDNN
jgi:hypothetical protein